MEEWEEGEIVQFEENVEAEESHEDEDRQDIKKERRDDGGGGVGTNDSKHKEQISKEARDLQIPSTSALSCSL